MSSRDLPVHAPDGTLLGHLEGRGVHLHRMPRVVVVELPLREAFPIGLDERPALEPLPTLALELRVRSLSVCGELGRLRPPRPADVPPDAVLTSTMREDRYAWPVAVVDADAHLELFLLDDFRPA